MLKFFKGQSAKLNVHFFPDLPLKNKIKFEKERTICGYFGRKYLNYRIIVTSTSYSNDEPLDILIEALRYIHKKDKILCVVTGKTKKDTNFKDNFQKNVKNVELRQLWLEGHDEYLKVLNSCDLGISFHKSTSGIDFPMKLVDMISVGIPVCSIYYEELEAWKRIKTFSSPLELYDIIKSCPKIEKTEDYAGPYWEEYSTKLLKVL